MFSATWAESYVFNPDKTGLPVRLICGEKMGRNNKSNVARYVRNKHTARWKREIKDCLRIHAEG